MAITSEDIHNQSFTVDRKGYDVDEVDVFLEHVAAEIDGLECRDRRASRLALTSSIITRWASDDDEPMDMDAAFAEPRDARTRARGSQRGSPPIRLRCFLPMRKTLASPSSRSKLAEKETDASAIANALVTAQRSAQEVHRCCPQPKRSAFTTMPKSRRSRHRRPRERREGQDREPPSKSSIVPTRRRARRIPRP